MFEKSKLIVKNRLAIDRQKKRSLVNFCDFICINKKKIVPLRSRSVISRYDCRCATLGA